MPTPTKGPRLGGSPAHQRLILANLAQNLFEHGKITTTEAKARRLRPYAEQLITKAKTDTVANRRQVVKVIRDKSVLHTLFTEIGPAMATRPGGYTRITKIGPRKGDNAPMAVIEIVEAKEFGAQNSAAQNQAPKAKSEKAAPVEEAPVEETTVDEGAVDETATDAADETPGTDPDVVTEPDAEETLDTEAPATDEPASDESVEEASSDKE